MPTDTIKQDVFSLFEGDGKNINLLGGKDANPCGMTQIELTVPRGFVISAEASPTFLDAPVRALRTGLLNEVVEQIRGFETSTCKGFGDPRTPLLMSVRPGSAMSMLGMMDTTLNLGLIQQTLPALIE